jgi:hypothetical protein
MAGRRRSRHLRLRRQTPRVSAEAVTTANERAEAVGPGHRARPHPDRDGDTRRNEPECSHAIPCAAAGSGARPGRPLPTPVDARRRTVERSSAAGRSAGATVRVLSKQPSRKCRRRSCSIAAHQEDQRHPYGAADLPERMSWRHRPATSPVTSAQPRRGNEHPTTGCPGGAQTRCHDDEGPPLATTTQ